MSEDDMFQQPEEVARELAQELRELKDLLRDIARKLGHIETRARRGFPAAFPKTPRPRVDKVPPSAPMGEPTLSPKEALNVYDELVGLARSGSREAVQSRLESLGLADLALLCKELGVSLGRKKPSRPSLEAGVFRRLNESVMLSTSNLRDRSKAGARGNSSLQPASVDSRQGEAKSQQAPDDGKGEDSR